MLSLLIGSIEKFAGVSSVCIALLLRGVIRFCKEFIMDLRNYHNEIFDYVRRESSKKEWIVKRVDMAGLLEELQRMTLKECTNRVFDAVDFANNYHGFGEPPAWIKVLDNWRGYNYCYPIDIGIVEFECDGDVYCHLRFYDGILGDRMIFRCSTFELLGVIDDFVSYDDDEEEIA